MGAPALAPSRAPAPSRTAPPRKKPRRAPARPPARRSTSAKPRPKTRAAAVTPVKPPPKARAKSARAVRPKLRVGTLSAVPGRINGRALAQSSLAGAALIPQAAVGAAGAVRDISDSSLIVKLTRGRGWIAVLCALLVGIVTLNVFSLSISTTSGRVSQQISEFDRANSALRATLAEELSATRVEETASAMGLTTPSGDQVTYLEAKDGDLGELARLLSGETVLTDGVAEPIPESSYEPAYIPAPDAEVTVPSSNAGSPSTTTPSPAAPVGTTPAPTAPTPTAPAPSPSGGGTSGGIGL